MAEQLDQIKAWLAGDLYPDHGTFAMGREFAAAVVAECDRLRTERDECRERYCPQCGFRPRTVTETVDEVSGTYNYDRGIWHESCVEEANR